MIFTDRGPILSAYAGPVQAGDILMLDTPYQAMDSVMMRNTVSGYVSRLDTIEAHAGRPVSGYAHLGPTAAADNGSYRSITSASDLREGTCILEVQYEEGSQIISTQAFFGYHKPVHWLNDSTVVVGIDTLTGIDTLVVAMGGLTGTRTQYTNRGLLMGGGVLGAITGPTAYLWGRYEYGVGCGHSSYPVDPRPRIGWDYDWFVKQ